MTNASAGGPWGMAVLAQYVLSGAQEKMEDYLDEKVFVNSEIMTLSPEQKGVAGAAHYIERYRSALSLENSASILKDEER